MQPYKNAGSIGNYQLHGSKANASKGREIVAGYFCATLHLLMPRVRRCSVSFAQSNSEVHGNTLVPGYPRVGCFRDFRHAACLYFVVVWG